MISNRTPQICVIQLIVWVLVFLVSSFSVLGQQTQYDRGTPPQHAAGVSPLGSYTSADIGTVNLSNGALNLKFPIGSVGGRGFWLPLTLNWSSKIWSGSNDTETDRDSSTKTVAYADFGKLDDFAGFYERLRPGWTVGIAPTLFNRIVRINYSYSVQQGSCYHYTLPKLTMMMPDKGEIEFRDDAYDGMPLPSDCSGYVATSSRGRRWHATDGSGTIYISDIDNAAAQRFGNLSGVVITSEGMRYHFGGGACDSITDRNGNKITFQYTNGITITDQLGRITTIQQNVADPQNPSVTLALLVTLPGFNGSHYYKVKTGTMNQHYRSDINPTLPVITGDYDPLGYNYGWGTATRLFNHSYGKYAQEIDIWEVPTELILPDTRSLHFSYNEYGEVAEIQMPTGGKVWYDYDGLNTFPSGNSAVWETSGDLHTQVFIDRGLRKRRNFPDGSTLECTWDYSYQGTSTQVTATSASGSLMLDQRHYFLAADRYYYPPISTGIPDGTQNTLWSTGIEYRTETRDAAGAIIAATEQDWTQRAALVWTSYPQEQLANDNRVNEERKILDDGSLAKVQTFYQANVKYNNPTEVKEFDYDQTLKRRTVTTYADSANLINGLDYTADSIHLLSLPLGQTVYDGSNNPMAQTVNEYDNYANDGNRAPLQDYGSVIQHDTNYGTSYSTRGNLTRLGRWLNPPNSFIYSYPRYDDLGNVVAAKDANGNVSTISFADDFGNGSNPGGGGTGTYGATYALPTLITSPPPQAGQPQQTARSQYDFSTGLLTGFKDRNGIISQMLYNDPFDRPTLVKSALGISGVESHAAMYYAPTTAFGISLTNNDVLTAKDQTSLDDATLRSWTRTDGFGRTVEAWSRDPQGDVKVVSILDALGRTKQISNPYRPSLGETPIYTTTVYDLAGRVTSVTTPDSATVNTAYNGNRVLVADQTARKRISVTDGLGRMKEVWEVTATDSATESVSFPGFGDVTAGYVTRYNYDTLDDLTNVSQRIGTNGTTQSRSFVYDSLKRLTSATNPESGTVCYGTLVNSQCQSNGYDANGNLVYKTDARGILTTYGYDALNRNTSITYTNDPANTPAVTRTYDNPTTGAYGKGRLWSTQTSASTLVTIDSYDALGRTNSQKQQFYYNNSWSQPYSISGISYDLAGHITSIIYPSQHTVNYNYDGAGRLADKDAQNLAFTGTLGDNAPRNYATGIIYDAASRMTKEQLGTTTAIYNKLFYNSRGQLAEIRESTSYTGPTDTTWNRGAIINDYSDTCSGVCAGQSMTDNNGNVKKQQHWIPDSNGNLVANFVQQYDYDLLNRLWRVADNLTTPTWRQQYTYDRYGNRTTNQGNTFNVGVPTLNFGVDPTTNRLSAPAGSTMSYDAAGNLTTDTYSAAAVTRAYDAENRMTSETQANGVAGSYSYDADGHRVRRVVGSTETWQVYGIGGELLAEYAANASPNAPQKEYGYRNGQLLITATVTAAGWGPPPSFTPPAILVSGVEIKLEHLTELRAAVNQLRGHAGLPQATWTVDPDPQRNVTTIKADHIRQLRAALEEARGHLGLSTGGYAHPTLTENTSWIYAIDFQELRDQVLSAWNNSTGGVDVRWLVSDQLGSPRMIFDQSGSLANMSRHDYLPFGEELGVNVGGRTSQQGYGVGDGVRFQFTDKERDNETGLDYFGARYYGSTQGRFTSADPLMSSGTIYNPQSWNRYSYTGNNPLRFIDPTGMWDWDASAGGSDTDEQLAAKRDNKSLKKNERNAAKDELKYRQRFRDALAGATALAQSGKLNSSQQAEVSRAVNSYGTEGDGNKVFVAFGPQGTGTGANTDGTAADDSIVVTFGRGAKGFDLIADVAHEGSHVLDNQSFDLLHSNGGMYFDGRNGDISQYETERRAYEVTSLVAQAAGKGSYLNDTPSYEVWSSGWKAAERETKRARGIDRVISTHYEVSPTNPGWTFGQIKSHVP